MWACNVWVFYSMSGFSLPVCDVPGDIAARLSATLVLAADIGFTTTPYREAILTLLVLP